MGRRRRSSLTKDHYRNTLLKSVDIVSESFIFTAHVVPDLEQGSSPDGNENGEEVKCSLAIIGCSEEVSFKV